MVLLTRFKPNDVRTNMSRFLVRVIAGCFALMIAVSSYAQPANPSRPSYTFPFAISGLRHGDNIDAALKLLGPPDRRNVDGSLTFLYWSDGKLGVTVDTATQIIRYVDVEGKGAVAALALAAGKDPMLGIIGMHKDEVVKLFSPRPRRSHGNRLEWEYTKENIKDAVVTITCYDHDQGVCSSLRLQWHTSAAQASNSPQVEWTCTVEEEFKVLQSRVKSDAVNTNGLTIKATRSDPRVPRKTMRIGFAGDKVEMAEKAAQFANQLHLITRSDAIDRDTHAEAVRRLASIKNAYGCSVVDAK